MSDVPRVLLTGGTGQIGWELRRTLASFTRVVAPDRAALPLEDSSALRAAVHQVHPALVINCAAFTAVDLAESKPAEAEQFNAIAPTVLAQECRARGVPLVHFSTDYVFDGEGDRPLRESDPTGPRSVYGRSKLAGEQAVLGSGVQCLVIRTAWIYGMRGRNFLRTMLRLAREREELRVVDDQIGTPTWSRLVAEGVSQILLQCRRGAGFELTGPSAGLLHLAAGGQTSWHGFARTLLALDPARQEQIATRITPVPTSGYPTPAQRPRYSVLDCRRAREVFGIELPGWEDQLALALASE